MNIESIKNYRVVTDRIATGGQPSQQQFTALVSAGFTRVINLATGNDMDFDEEQLAARLELAYTAIPVEWSAPTRDDFSRFIDAVENAGSGKLFIHCAANYRVTGFFGLYGMVKLGWSGDEAEAFISKTWNPDEYPVWRAFINSMKDEYSK